MNVIKALPSLLIEEADVRHFAAALADVVAGAERMPQAITRLAVRMARGSARAHRERQRIPAR
jgi:hypothetical protein